ncbi:hypothetical protein [Methylocystis sp. S23]
MKTARDLYVYTLENALGVVGTGQPVEEDDIQTLRKALPSLLAMLRRMDVADVRINPDNEAYESIPEEVLSPLADLLANEVAQSYGRAKADRAGMDILLGALARVTANSPHYMPQVVDYF